MKDETPANPASVVFAVAFALFAFFLLSQLGSETKFSARGKLFAQPRFWPAVAVYGMALFALLHIWHCWRERRRDAQPGTLTELFNWIKALEYLCWFMLYVYLVPLLGYLPVTILFAIALSLRTGYRSGKQVAIAAVLAIAIVLIFKTGLSVRIPGGAVYEYLPDSIRNFMIINL